MNAGGLWARHVGEMAGIELPVTVVEHQYLVTEKSPLIPDKLPTLRDPDLNFYLKSEPGALAIGGWEKGTIAPYGLGKLPMDFGQELFAGNMDRLSLFAENAAERLPVLNEVGIRTIINGPIPVSADGEPVMGHRARASTTSSSPAASPPASRPPAAPGPRWRTGSPNGDPGMDLWAVRPAPLRQAATTVSPTCATLAIESLRAVRRHRLAARKSATACRPLRRSPLYSVLKNKGACSRLRNSAANDRTTSFEAGEKGPEHRVF